ncbi:IclR family transcriptional regulator [Anoxybacterium hadale]|uniref:IclR family transcriptional regulator n=1 Tax=Anoxybacterium hadale TaxID=3408580 RepID=A0ACD1AER4_9FIRM|nr:IclR family transcriptional regulator [Clostridiales bacterium]
MNKDKTTPIEKALLIMETMSNHPEELKVAELSELTGLNRTTVHRILGELLAKEWVIQDYKTRKFMIGPMAFHVGMAYTNHNNMESKILEVINTLCEQIKESVGYAIREGDKVISIYETEIHQPYKMNYHPGKFYPINRGAYAKCLMAYYDQDRVKQLLLEQTFEKVAPNTLTDPEEIMQEYAKIRAQGYALSEEEVAPLVMGIGVPVFSKTGEVKGCLACAFLKGQDKDEKVETFLRLFRQGAEQISHYLY